MKLLAPSTPSVRTLKVLTGANAIRVTVETLTSCVKVKLLMQCGEGMTRIDGSKSSRQPCNPSNLVCKIYF